MEPSILLLKMGVPSPELLPLSGDYDAWFAAGFGVDRVRITSVAAHLGAAIPSHEGFDAVIASGSPLSVTERAPWMQRAGQYLIEAAQRGKQVLAVCFGHQLVAQALGAEVARNPQGREIGTVRVQSTPQGTRDPLFAGLGAAFSVQATHVDAVLSLPEEVTLLADNAFGVQAYVFARHLHAVQFHPELDPPRMRDLIESRRAVLEEEGILQAARESVQPTPAGRTILANFLKLI